MKRFILGLMFLLVFVLPSGASQHDYVLDNNPGATFRADLNSVLGAIVTNNSAATEPTTKYPNMWWYDTSTGLLKRRSNANDAWIIMGLEAADSDGTFAANSDSNVPTQKAAKTYIDAKTIAENRLSISDNTTANATTSAHGYLKKLSNVATEFMNGVGNWVAVTIDSILPSQTGNSGKFLTTNGSSASWGSVASTTPILTSDTTKKSLIASATTERTHFGNVYTKYKEVRVWGAGTVYVSFAIQTASGTFYGKIYVNGSPVGTERTASSGYGYQIFDETISVNYGDLVQIYLRSSHSGGYGTTKDFKLYAWPTEVTLD